MALEVHGTCDAAFAPVRDAFAEGFRLRGELGAAVAVVADGRTVVDLWAGDADPVRGAPWQRGTIAHVYSATKPLAAACLLLLVERGALGLDTPVVDVWPEYGAAGKHATLVRHVLAHETGLVALRDPVPADVLLDHDRVAALLAAEPPLWPPGSGRGEQALFFGHLVGELVRRLDGRTLGRFLAEEIARPWALDFHVGLGPDEQARAARLVDPGGAWRRSLLADPRPLLVPALDNPPGALDADVVCSAAWREAEIAAVNGHGGALALARFHAGLAAGGTLDGVRLLAPETVETMLRPQSSGHDALLDDEVAWGLGLHADTGDGWFGMGGIGGFAGLGLRRPGLALGYGYVTARLGGHERSDACEGALERVVTGG